MMDHRDGQSLFKIELIDGFTGRIRVVSVQKRQQVSGKWRLEIDGVRHSFGQFMLRDVDAGEAREILLSVEVPDAVSGAEAWLIVELSEKDSLPVVAAFPMPVPAYLPPPGKKGEFFTGLRFDLSRAIISGGKLSAEIDANGMRNLRYNGEKLLTCGPRLSLFRAGKVPESLRELKRDRLRISPDRFVSDGKSVESHALVLPSKMELDELEFTQKFTPLNDGTLRYDAEFVVPESFSGLPRLGVMMRLPGNMQDISCFGVPPVNSPYPGAVKSRYTTNADEISRQYFDGGCYRQVKFVTFSDREKNGCLKIFSTGRNFAFAAARFNETAISEAVAAGKGLPAAESEIYLYIDCRIGEEAAVKAGVYRMTLFFSYGQ